MAPRERTIYLSIIGLITLINISLVAATPMGAAFADGASNWLDKLGPAESVELTTTDEDAASLDLRNRDGRLSWGDTPAQRAHAVAFVHVGKPISLLIQTDAYQERRNELIEQLRAEGAEYETVLQGMLETLQGMEESDPGFVEAQTEFNQRYQVFQRWQQEAAQRDGQQQAQMIKEAYDEVVAAVDVVADRMGIDIVLRSTPLDAEFQPTNANEAQLLIRGRTAVKAPEGLDITVEVLDELGLE